MILKKNGRKLKEVLVYKTELVHHQVARQFDGILFFSPSAVDSFFHSNKLAKEVVLFAIGATTAAAIKTHGNHELLIAEETSAESLLKKVIERYFGKQAH